MEIPVIFDASQLASVIGRFSPPQRFWNYGALLLAFLYAFTSVIRKLKLLFLQRHRQTSKLIFSSSEPLLSGSDTEDDEQEDVKAVHYSDVSCSSEDEDAQDDFRVAGRRRFKSHRRRRSFTGDAFSSLAELVSGKGVVKLWDGLSLRDCSSSGLVSIFDFDRNVAIGSIPAGGGGFSAVTVSPGSPRVVVTASGGSDGRVGLRSWDMRVRRRRAAAEAEWGVGAVAGIEAGGVEKVYVRDDVAGKVTVGDMRKAGSPLGNVTECDGERWFEVDGVSETEEEE